MTATRINALIAAAIATASSLAFVLQVMPAFVLTPAALA